MVPLLSLIAMILAVVGILKLLGGQLATGIGWLIVAALIGPGGISIFT